MRKGPEDMTTEAGPPARAATQPAWRHLTGSPLAVLLIAVALGSGVWNYVAASQNRAAAVTALLKRGANPDAQTKTIDVSKQSALDRAAVERQRDHAARALAADVGALHRRPGCVHAPSFVRMVEIHSGRGQWLGSAWISASVFARIASSGASRSNFSANGCCTCHGVTQ